MVALLGRESTLKLTKLSDEKTKNISGGNKEEFFNTCKKCGKIWDMRDYGYGTEDPMPNWVTGPWCPECRKKLSEGKPKD